MNSCKAVRIHAYGDPDVLQYEDIPRPRAAPGEVLVRVRAAGVNPVDYKIRSGAVRAMFATPPFPTALGGDIAGVVEAVGEGVDHFRVGDAVFGMIGLLGAYAEYVAVKAQMLALKPQLLDFVEAASVPLAALTAWQALFDVARVEPGQRVLVHAAAGGVGGFAVQLARQHGARVTGTASPANADYLRSLGAEAVIDYRSTPIESMPADFDVVLDLAGGDTGPRSLACLKPGGIVVVVAGRPAARDPDEHGRRLAGTVVQPDGDKLARIARLIDARQVRSEIAAVFPLAEAGAAQALIAQGHTRGKIVLQVAG